MWAASLADDVTVHHLLSNHATVGLKDREERTALHYACRVGSLECVNHLLGAGADPRVHDINGKTPLHDAMYQILPQSLAEELVLALKSHNADLNAQDDDGWTPLYNAAEMKKCAGIRALSKFGGDTDVPNYHELPPICRAIVNSDYEVIKTLCEVGTGLFWNTTLHSIDNVLKELALTRTMEAMKIIANSNSPLIDYDPEEIEFWISAYRDHENIQGERFSVEEEFAAFESLLDKKGIKIGPPVECATQLEDASWNIEQSNQDASDEEGIECFQDALEIFS